MFNNIHMTKKERSIGLRLTGALEAALEAYCETEERSRSAAVRYLLARELERLGFLSGTNIANDKTRKTGVRNRK